MPDPTDRPPDPAGMAEQALDALLPSIVDNVFEATQLVPPGPTLGGVPLIPDPNVPENAPLYALNTRYLEPAQQEAMPHAQAIAPLYRNVPGAIAPVPQMPAPPGPWWPPAAGGTLGGGAASETPEGPSAKAIRVAYELLEQAIGKAEAAKVAGGGAYLIQSKLWPEVYYGVAREGKVLVLQSGYSKQVKISESCLQALTPGLPWPDHVLAKIKAIQADETIVFATGVVESHPLPPGELANRLQRNPHTVPPPDAGAAQLGGAIAQAAEDLGLFDQMLQAVRGLRR